MWHIRNGALSQRARKCFNSCDYNKAVTFLGIIIITDLIFKELIMMKHRFAYAGTLEAFMDTDIESWYEGFKKKFIKNYPDKPVSDSQERSWKDCYESLKTNLADFYNRFNDFNIVFEYELVFNDDKRPDVILFNRDFVFILEYKRKNEILPEDITQLKGYFQQINGYHKASSDRTVVPILVLSGADEMHESRDDEITVISDSQLSRTLKGCIAKHNILEWVNSDYQPLPGLIQGSIERYLNGNFPMYDQVNSTCIPDAREFIISLADEAERKHQRKIVFVTGVPGAGKTFLGMDVTYKTYGSSEAPKSAYLSGNGPLVKVLSNLFKDRGFIHPISRILNSYIKNDHYIDRNIVVFDEGQRAWDRANMQKRYKTSRVNKNEAEYLIEIMERKTDWSLLLVLIGEGQAIYNGETLSISDWNSAILNGSQNWEVYCPPNIKFSSDLDVTVNADLNLTKSLRSQLAVNLSDGMNDLLDLNIAEAKKKLTEARRSYSLYVTRDLDRAKSFVKNAIGSNARYGLIASSKSIILPSFGVKNDFKSTQNIDYASWYNKGAGERGSCCNLDQCVTEFGVQGLELDFPIMCWDEDFAYNANFHQWEYYQKSSYKSAITDADAKEYRINSYRVLLTRGRSGMIIYVPETRNLDDTYNLLVRDLSLEVL